MNVVIRRVGVAFAAVVTAGSAVLVGPGGASAERQQVPASGNTTIRLGVQLARTIQGNGCGNLTALHTTGSASSAILDGGRVLKLVFPVVGVVETTAGGMRINHSGGIEFATSCLDLKFTRLTVQNFGQADQQVVLEVLAKTFEDGDARGRTQAFTLDLSSADITTFPTRGRTTIRGMHVLLGSDGAQEFNLLSTGSPDGPLTAGEQVGNARTTIRLS